MREICTSGSVGALPCEREGYPTARRGQGRCAPRYARSLARYARSRTLTSPPRGAGGAFALENERQRGSVLMLRIHAVVIELIREVAPVANVIARRDSDLAKQLRSALSSVALNIAEVAPGKAWEEEA